MKSVTIYSTPSCHFCRLAKEYFKENNIGYTEFDVAANIEKREEMVTLSGQLGVPVIRIGDDVLVGFNRPMVAKLLEMDASRDVKIAV